MWTCGLYISRKAPITWKKVCSPENHGGLDIISLEVWNKANMVSLLWDLSGKSSSLWVKWIYTYYIKGKQFMEVNVKSTFSWIMRVILKQREKV